MIKTKGFTIVELMVVLLIIVIIGLFTMPYLETAVINSKIRATAESLQNGFRKAQLAAASRNGAVRIYLTEDPVNSDQTKHQYCDENAPTFTDVNSVKSLSKAYWTICSTKENQRTLKLGSGNSIDDNLPNSQALLAENAQVAIVVSEGDRFKDKNNYVEFRGSGGTNINTQQIFSIESVQSESNAPNGQGEQTFNCATDARKGNVQCLKVILSPGGRSRVCNPMYDNVRDANNRINSMACKQS